LAMSWPFLAFSANCSVGLVSTLSGGWSRTDGFGFASTSHLDH
jgi:hypothetical protein